MKITSKSQFFEMWLAGVLGNRTRLWKDPQKALEDVKKFGIKEIGFREIRPKGAGAGKWERIPSSDLLCTAAKWIGEGRRFMMDDVCPDDKQVLQGEICRTPHLGLTGFLSTTSRIPMRPAMAQGMMHHCSPLTTKMLIERYMDPNSQEDLWTLLEMYPDAAVEFSTFSVNVGVFPFRNTLFWETRDY